MTTSVTPKQVMTTRMVVEWYLRSHFGTDADQGVVQTFANASMVGAFAVDPAAVASHDPQALFRLLMAIVMFQRRQDQQIQRILRGLSRDDARELTSLDDLLALASRAECGFARSNVSLRTSCDLAKDSLTKAGTCGQRPGTPCHLKRHTVLLRRYGHFGKVPTSLALTVFEAGAADLPDLLRRAAKSGSTPHERARAMITALSASWRVNDKIASMFLSIVWNPDMTPGVVDDPSVDWRHFVVIDSNVDGFLRAIGGPKTYSYEARRTFLRELSSKIDLSSMGPTLRRDNPRVVQQAMYLFMSWSNRRAIPSDCMHRPDTCDLCPRPVAKLCPVRGGVRRLAVIT